MTPSSKPTHIVSHFRHYQPTSIFLSLHQIPLSRRFFSTSSETPTDHDQIAHSLSLELVKDLDSEPLSIVESLRLSFSHVIPTPTAVLAALNLSSEVGRTVLGFNDWLISNPNFQHSDEKLSFFVHYFSCRKDFKAIHDVIIGSRDAAGPKTLASAIDRIVRTGRLCRQFHSLREWREIMDSREIRIR